MKTYYLFEKNENGGNSYKKYTLEELKKYFEPVEDAGDEEVEAYNSISDIDGLNDFIERFVNDVDGIHYHDYSIEVAEDDEENRNLIKMWRENSMLSRAEMSRRMDIPVRTIENWESGVNTPPSYVERLVVNELMRITEKELEERGRKRMAKLKSDEEGKRPIGSWAVIASDKNDEFVTCYYSMFEAINHVNDGYPAYVAYIACNDTEDGPQPWYEDRNGNVESDHDSIKL